MYTVYMNVVASVGHLKYKINANDHLPPHVHCEAFGASLRVNLLTLEVMDEKTEFGPSTVRKILALVKERQVFFLAEWEKVHGKKD